MKTATKELGKCKVELTVTLEAAESAGVIREVERAFVREARIPGFRPGKAPIEVIRKSYGDQIAEEIKTAAVRKFYADAVKDAKIDDVAPTGVKDVKLTAEGGSFVAEVDVKPVFKLPTYKGLKIAPADLKVEDADVAAQVERLRVNYAKYESAKDGEAAAAGDYVEIDYSGTVDGKPILEIAPEAKVVATGTGFWTQIEEGRFRPEILEALKGMKAGETKDGIKVTFEKDAAPEPLKGKKAVYTVTLKSFRRRILPTDAEFAEQAKVASVDEIAKKVRESMEKQRVASESARRENEAIELLMKKIDFDVPESQKERAMDVYLNQLAERAQYAGLPAEYFQEHADEIRKDAEEHAVKQVRIWYVIDAIAAAEKIEASDDDRGKKVIEFLLANAKA